jgi:hypothetical protein
VNSIPRKTRHPFCAPESISISQADRSHLLEATKQSTLVAFCPMVARKMHHVLFGGKKRLHDLPPLGQINAAPGAAPNSAA